MAARRHTPCRVAAASPTNQVARSPFVRSKGVHMKRVGLCLFTMIAILLTCSFALRNSRISASFSTPPRSANLTAGFTRLETELYGADKKKDLPRCEQLLASDYVLVASARAGDPMDRKSWLDLIAVYNVESFTVGDVVVR